MCETENAADPSHAGRSASGVLAPEFVHHEVEYRTPLTDLSASISSMLMRRSHSTSSLDGSNASLATAPPPGLVLVIDRNMTSRAEALGVVEALELTLQSPALDPATPLTLLTFGASVSLYRLGRLGGRDEEAQALEHDVLDRAVTGSDRERLSAGFAQGEYWAPLFAARHGLLASLRTMAHDGTFRTQEEGTGGGLRLEKDGGKAEERRFLGTAIDCLNQCYPECRRARVWVFTTGPPFGPGDPAPGSSILAAPLLLPGERRQYFTRLSQGARQRGLALDACCLGLAAHFDTLALRTLVARTGGSVLLYPSARDRELSLDLEKLLTVQTLPEPTEVATLELRVSAHMDIASLLLPEGWAEGGREQWEVEAGPAGAEGATASLRRSSGSTGRLSRSSSALSLPEEEDAGGGALSYLLESGGMAARAVGSRLRTWASSAGNWSTGQGAEGDGLGVEAFGGGEGRGKCGPALSLAEGWAWKHAQEKAAGVEMTPPRLPYCQTLRKITWPRWPATPGGGAKAGMDVGLLYRPRDTVFGIWGTRSDSFIFQSILRSIEGGWLVTRVLSLRIQAKTTTQDHSALPVLALKRAVLRLSQQLAPGILASPGSGTAPAAATTAAAGARREVDSVVEEIRTLFPRLHAYVRKRGGFGRPCGSELEGAVEVIYQGHRGPLLGRHQQGEDVACALRYRFLTLGLEEATRMLSPVLLSTGPLIVATSDATTEVSGNQGEAVPGGDGKLQSWPCQTMALWPDLVLLLDTQDRLVIWIGREAALMLAAGMEERDGPLSDPKYGAWLPGSEAAQQSLQVCRAYAEQARQDRFPTPQVVEVVEGDPMERFLWASLIPTHKDPPDVLFSRFPALRSMPPERVEALRNQFSSMATEDESLQQYLDRLTPAAVKMQAHYTAAGSASATQYAHHHAGSKS
jgi:hypothetical protein